MFICRGIRGATTATDNSKDSILSATTELLMELEDTNGIDPDFISAIWLTTSPDLTAEFPAVAARRMGWTQVPLLCGHEMDVPDALPKCIRVLILFNTEKSSQEITHIYLREAVNLRKRGTSDT